MPAWFDAKDERQYQHVLASTGSKAIAGAVVNKNRTRQKKTKKFARNRRRRNG